MAKKVELMADIRNVIMEKSTGCAPEVLNGICDITEAAYDAGLKEGSRTLPAEVGQVYEALEVLLTCMEMNSGHEPSISCLYRAEDEARKALTACQHLRNKGE